MLARTEYMSAKALGIKEWEHYGLRKFVENVRNGTIVLDRDLCETELHKFSMECGFIDFQCGGTIGCIGGYTAYYADHPHPSDYVYELSDSHPLDKLYFPTKTKLTVKRAANVVEHFLLTGEVDWGVP